MFKRFLIHVNAYINQRTLKKNVPQFKKKNETTLIETLQFLKNHEALKTEVMTANKSALLSDEYIC